MKRGTKMVRYVEKHDRLEVWGTFTTGASFRFIMTRGENGDDCAIRERVQWSGNNDETENRRQGQVFQRFCAIRDGETNGSRCERIRSTAERANSAAEFIALMGKPSRRRARK